MDAVDFSSPAAGEDDLLVLSFSEAFMVSDLAVFPETELSILASKRSSPSFIFCRSLFNPPVRVAASDPCELSAFKPALVASFSTSCLAKSPNSRTIFGASSKITGSKF